MKCHCILSNKCDQHKEPQNPSVPRVASSIDDLRVGQVVALVAFPKRRFIGEVLSDGQVTGSWDNGELMRCFPDDEDHWFILSDPPPEPVTVSPALVDALEDAENALCGKWAHDTIFNLRHAARALVDEVVAQTDPSEKEPAE